MTRSGIALLLYGLLLPLPLESVETEVSFDGSAAESFDVHTYYVYTCYYEDSDSPFFGNRTMVNITLSAEDNLVAKARAYAQSRNTTVNQLIRDYLGRLTGQIDPQQAAEEFAALAHNHGGRSDKGFVFDRRDVHVRGKDASR